jgi:hypothetical protein
MLRRSGQPNRYSVCCSPRAAVPISARSRIYVRSVCFGEGRLSPAADFGVAYDAKAHGELLSDIDLHSTPMWKRASAGALDVSG